MRHGLSTRGVHEKHRVMNSHFQNHALTPFVKPTTKHVIPSVFEGSHPSALSRVDNEFVDYATDLLHITVIAVEESFERRLFPATRVHDPLLSVLVVELEDVSLLPLPGRTVTRNSLKTAIKCDWQAGVKTCETGIDWRL